MSLFSLTAFVKITRYTIIAELGTMLSALAMGCMESRIKLRLDVVERLMEDYPDSAFAILNGIGTDSLWQGESPLRAPHVDEAV